ncbi:MAG: HAD hydrolase-like protein [Verrucomicrobia bacterium]|nr:HAD hydrolase-like protein [Verrucomicrobiota bacterium]
MIRLVLFDIDGTLIRTGGAGQKAFDRVCETQFNVPNGTVQLAFAGRTDPAIVRDFFKRHRIEPSPDNFRRFLDAYVFWLDHLMAQYPGQVLSGVRELLRGFEALPQPPVLGLLTGNIRLGAQIKLTYYRLWEHFRMGAFGDDHEDRNQLAVVALERGCRQLRTRLRGDEVLVVGDTPRDIACSRMIGARVLAVATGGSPYAELACHQPDWLVSTLDRISAADVCNGSPRVVAPATWVDRNLR